jgi:hypothetical protein
MSGRLGIHQEWTQSLIPIQPCTETWYHPPIRFGAVIGTFASVPYIHLQLEAAKRFYPHVPLLVHDDHSSRAGELSVLCRQYGCDFESNTARLPHHLGDLSAFWGGLCWARQRGIDLLVKLSRRWLFLLDWTRSLQELALTSQYATFSNHTTTFGYGFRTECVGMAVRAWSMPHVTDSLAERILEGRHVFVESYIHQFAVAFENHNGSCARQWRAAHPAGDGRLGYAPWGLMGEDRCSPAPAGSHLWHDCHLPQVYADVSKEWGLPYSVEDFGDPNQGEGNGPANS